MYFCTLCLSVGYKERNRQALDRLPLVSKFLTNFWTEHFDGARLSPNSVRNAIWHALNEPVCQYLRTRNPRCSTVYIDNSLGPLARDSPFIVLNSVRQHKWFITQSSYVGYMFRLLISHLQAYFNRFNHTLGSQHVYTNGIHKTGSFASKGVMCNLCN